MTDFKFPKFAPEEHKCKKCGRTPLWIDAFIYKEGKKTIAIPMIVCDSHYGCGTVFELSEYDLTEGQLCK